MNEKNYLDCIGESEATPGVYIASHRWTVQDAIFKVGCTACLQNRLGDTCYTTCFPGDWYYEACFETVSAMYARTLEGLVFKHSEMVRTRVDQRELFSLSLEAIVQIVSTVAAENDIWTRCVQKPSYIPILRTSSHTAVAPAPASPFPDPAMLREIPQFFRDYCNACGFYMYLCKKVVDGAATENMLQWCALCDGAIRSKRPRIMTQIGVLHCWCYMIKETLLNSKKKWLCSGCNREYVTSSLDLNDLEAKCGCNAPAEQLIYHFGPCFCDDCSYSGGALCTMLLYWLQEVSHLQKNQIYALVDEHDGHGEMIVQGHKTEYYTSAGKMLISFLRHLPEHIWSARYFEKHPEQAVAIINEMQYDLLENLAIEHNTIACKQFKMFT